jgi:nitrate reductase (NAD(P)H)
MYGETLVGEAAEAEAFDRMWDGAQRDAGDAPIALDPKKWIPLVCDAKVPLSHDTILLRLKLESEGHQCGLPVGYHLYLRGDRNGKKVMRAYTPSSLNGTLGAVEFVIKIYFPNDHPNFPEGGQLTQYLNAVNVGDVVEVKGPMGHIKYAGCGRLLVDKNEHIIDKMTMIGGGTGVAPMLQMIVAVLANPADKTQIKFLFANKTTKDILLKYTLDRLQRENPDRFSVHYTVSKGDEHWPGSIGRVNKKMIEDYCFPAHDSRAQSKTVALLCGPPSLEEDTCIPALKELGYENENIIQY